MEEDGILVEHRFDLQWFLRELRKKYALEWKRLA